MVGTLQAAVASTTVAGALSSTSLRVSWATLQALQTNTQPVQVRAPAAASPTGYILANPGDSFVLWSPASLHLAIDLAEVFILPGVSGEGVCVTYVK